MTLTFYDSALPLIRPPKQLAQTNLRDMMEVKRKGENVENYERRSSNF
jgi:hypothetical protein